MVKKKKNKIHNKKKKKKKNLNKNKNFCVSIGDNWFGFRSYVMIRTLKQHS
jgi:hypothetical protein